MEYKVVLDKETVCKTSDVHIFAMACSAYSHCEGWAKFNGKTWRKVWVEGVDGIASENEDQFFDLCLLHWNIQIQKQNMRYFMRKMKQHLKADQSSAALRCAEEMSEISPKISEYENALIEFDKANPWGDCDLRPHWGDWSNQEGSGCDQ